ncbi:hypothetical protein AB0A73_07985 [Glycomyces sp. NPDC047369]
MKPARFLKKLSAAAAAGLIAVCVLAGPASAGGGNSGEITKAASATVSESYTVQNSGEITP